MKINLHKIAILAAREPGCTKIQAAYGAAGSVYDMLIKRIRDLENTIYGIRVGGISSDEAIEEVRVLDENNDLDENQDFGYSDPNEQ